MGNENFFLSLEDYLHSVISLLNELVSLLFRSFLCWKEGGRGEIVADRVDENVVAIGD